MARIGMGAALLLVLSATSFASTFPTPVILSHKTELYVNQRCVKFGNCGFVRSRYVVEDYKIAIEGDYSYGTRFFAEYTTDSVAALEDYVFVQFIKGCVYSTRLENDVVVRSNDVAVNIFGNARTFKFDKWIIDSDNPDPVYSSSPDHPSRHALCKWNKIPRSFAKESSEYYVEKRPKKPILYISDRPSTAFLDEYSARNVSLQFKMCLYRTADVPRTGLAPEDINFAKPLHCYSWKSFHVYDHKSKKFSRTRPAQAVCE